ncbi:MAG: hypothetical protein M3Y06_10480, partial [Actinomycetota bacterium]|nr:hypothetical protein [Actinomycetota bacterium]
MVFLFIVLAVVVLAILVTTALVVPRRLRGRYDDFPVEPGVDYQPGEAAEPRDSPNSSVGTGVERP